MNNEPAAAQSAVIHIPFRPATNLDKPQEQAEAEQSSSTSTGAVSPSGPQPSPKEVRFSEDVKIIVCSPVHRPNPPARVSFNDKIHYIDSPTKTVETSTKQQKRVRFGCIKQPKQPLSRGLSLLRVLKRQTSAPLPGTSISSRQKHIRFPPSWTSWRQHQKRVRFGALKGQGPREQSTEVELRDRARDEAETRLAFKRECVRLQDLQPLSPLSPMDGAEGYDWGAT